MSWTILPVTEAEVRTYLDIQGTSGQFSTPRIGSNIRAAASFIQRSTSRQFEPQTATTKTFTTDGKAYISIPDLRSATGVTLQSAALTLNASYWLVEDATHASVYTGVQFRAFGGNGSSYLSNPEWFDRNLDRDWARGYGNSSLPNDLAITGDWGWSPYPDDFIHAVLVLASFYTRRPASTLADVEVTPEGTEKRFSRLPVEVREFIEQWMGGSQVAVMR